MSDTIKVVKYYNEMGKLFFRISHNDICVAVETTEDDAIRKARELEHFIKENRGIPEPQEILHITI